MVRKQKPGREVHIKMDRTLEGVREVYSFKDISSYTLTLIPDVSRTSSK